jgi:hypothetical protein
MHMVDNVHLDQLLQVIKGNGLSDRSKRWTKEECQQIALLYRSRVDFQRGNGGAYQIARKNDWLNTICYHMLPLRVENGSCSFNIMVMLDST